MSVAKEIYDAKLDPDYQEAYVDVDEWRERTLWDGRVVTYRYIHGGFEKKGVKFSYCFPEKEAFRGRFFQYLSPFPGPDEELASLERTGEDDRIGFCLVNGAYYVESNMGSTSMFGAKKDDHLVWKSSAAVAEYSRVKAMEIYGFDRPYGYVYGGSGGGYKTMACIENTNAWDGAVPFVIGSPVSLPNTITLHAQGQRTLRHVFGKIVDALDAGGSGDMYEGLTEDETAMLKEITAMGFPPKVWFPEAEGRIDDGSLPVLTPGVKMADSKYFQEFWEVPGYLGADPDSNAVRDRLQFRSVVKSVHLPGEALPEELAELGLDSGTEAEIGEGEIDGRNGVDDAWKKQLTSGNGAWIELEELPVGDDLYLKGVNINFETGDAVGKQLLLGDMVPGADGKGGYLTIGMCYGMDDLPGVLSLVKPGDTVFLDNSDYIAIQSYYRHQVPADLSFHAWDQFRDEDGKPTLPQRDSVMGYGFTGTGTVQDGNLQGKVIVVQALMDESTCPWCGDWYRNKVIETMGNEEGFRIYYMDHCMHGDVSMLMSTRIVNYLGALYQSLLDVSDWVERGIEPLPRTNYELVDGQIIVPDKAEDRKGVQPVPTLLANGSTCARVKVGETVTFTARAEVPEDAGCVTAVDYNFGDVECEMGDGVFTVKGEFESTVNGKVNGATSTITHSYDKPGTYFAAVRVMSNRHGDASNIYTQVKNLERARIIVE